METKLLAAAVMAAAAATAQNAGAVTFEKDVCSRFCRKTAK